MVLKHGQEDCGPKRQNRNKKPPAVAGKETRIRTRENESKEMQDEIRMGRKQEGREREDSVQFFSFSSSNMMIAA